MLAHDKAGTVSQLADKIRDRNPDHVKALRKATKRGGHRWSEAMDRVRASLKADNRLKPVLQSAVISHWLFANSSTAQVAQDSMRATMHHGWAKGDRRADQNGGGAVTTARRAVGHCVAAGQARNDLA